MTVDPRQFGVLNMHQVVVGQAATEAEAITLAAELEATYPWVAHDTPRGRRLTEALARRDHGLAGGIRGYRGGAAELPAGLGRCGV